jgi:dihydroorotate dehydrogenase electron transfer subunit
MSPINKSANQITATIISNKRIGVYHQILLEVGDAVRFAKPGNFIAISVGGDYSKMVLRRAFAISRIADRGEYRAIELIVAPHGSGSGWLCAQPAGVELSVVLPLGTAFKVPTEPVSALLIGGGYGSAPLFGLAEVLRERGCRVNMLLGASTAAKIYAPLEGKRSVNSLKIYTEDGSGGETGRVTEPIAQIIREQEIKVIYSCGPMAMLSAISKIAVEHDVAHQCAVEESMACGVGICMTCVLPVKDEAGEVKMVRSCIDGPVMDSESVLWESVGKPL